jgi:hypothetical protein
MSAILYLSVLAILIGITYSLIPNMKFTFNEKVWNSHLPTFHQSIQEMKCTGLKLKLCYNNNEWIILTRHETAQLRSAIESISKKPISLWLELDQRYGFLRLMSLVKILKASNCHDRVFVETKSYLTAAVLRFFGVPIALWYYEKMNKLHNFVYKCYYHLIFLYLKVTIISIHPDQVDQILAGEHSVDFVVSVDRSGNEAELIKKSVSAIAVPFV